MPYTKAPSVDTYSQEDVSLTRKWTSRQNDPSGSRDEQFLNCIFEAFSERELGDKRKFIFKRSGTEVYITPSSNSAIRGLFFWADEGLLVYAQDNDVYMYNTSTAATITCSNVFGTTSGDVGFCTYLYDTGSVVLIATDGTTLISITNTGTVVTCVDADLPAPHIPIPIFLDGYLFLAEEDTASIWNSDLNDPMAWTAGNFIDAELDGDHVVGLSKINNYILAFGSTTIEYFWDAGIETGSPLQRNETPVKFTRFLGGLAQSGNTLYFIGTASSGEINVFKLQDFQIESIGDPTVVRYLNTLNNTIADFNGGVVSMLGHTYYVLNADGRTFVFDVQSKDWVRWAFKDFNSFNLHKSVPLETTTAICSVFTIGDSQIIYRFNDEIYQDADVDFTTVIITDNVDFGTLNRKSMSRMGIVGDRPSADSNIVVSWSDDDYKTYSDTIDVNLNQDFPTITRLGNFRRRAFKLEYTDNYPLRLDKLTVYINKGRN